MRGRSDAISPNRPRLTARLEKRHPAYALGHGKLYGTDRGAGYKLPAIFAERGLGRVRLDGAPHVALGSEDFVLKRFKLQWHRYVVRRFEHPTRAREENERILTLGGMTSEEVAKVKRLEYERSKRILRDPVLLDADFSMDASLYTMTTGVKQ